MCFLRVSERVEIMRQYIAHQFQLKLSPKPLSNPDADLNPNQEVHEYH